MFRDFWVLGAGSGVGDVGFGSGLKRRASDPRFQELLCLLGYLSSRLRFVWGVLGSWVFGGLRFFYCFLKSGHRPACSRRLL